MAFLLCHTQCSCNGNTEQPDFDDDAGTLSGGDFGELRPVGLKGLIGRAGELSLADQREMMRLDVAMK